MRYLALIALLAGVLILGLVAATIDWAEVWGWLRQLGGAGFALILGVFFAAFLFDTLAWQLTLPSIGRNAAWTARLFGIRMIGSALNQVLPLASLGGEPVKAVLLNLRFGVEFRETTASFLLSETIKAVALVAFAVLGGLWMFVTSAATPELRLNAMLGTGALALFVLAFFLIQRLRLVSRSFRMPLLRRAQTRLRGLLGIFGSVEDQLIAFYTRQGRDCFRAILLAFAGWVLGAVEVFATFAFLGHPISFGEAWVIEASVMVVRMALFFVPAQIGAQEGVFLIVAGAITGSPALAIAMAIVRRLRELSFVALGLAVGWPQIRLARRNDALARPTPPTSRT